MVKLLDRHRAVSSDGDAPLIGNCNFSRHLCAIFAAAFRAMSDRASGDSLSARARPPFKPPARAKSDTLKLPDSSGFFGKSSTSPVAISTICLAHWLRSRGRLGCHSGMMAVCLSPARGQVQNATTKLAHYQAPCGISPSLLGLLAWSVTLVKSFVATGPPSRRSMGSLCGQLSKNREVPVKQRATGATPVARQSRTNQSRAGAIKPECLPLRLTSPRPVMPTSARISTTLSIRRTSRSIACASATSAGRPASGSTR